MALLRGLLQVWWALPVGAQITGDPPASSVWIGSVKQLFVTDELVESAARVNRVMNVPTKLGRRVLQPDSPWERALNVSFDLYNSVLREEVEVGGYRENVTRFWYFAVQPGASDASLHHGTAVQFPKYLQAYAELRDDAQIATKPALEQVALNGPAAGLPNNVLAVLSGDTQREGTSVWIDERRSLGGRYVSHAKIWKSPNSTLAGNLGVSVSDDGLVWRDVVPAFWDPIGPNGEGEGCDTQSNAFFDESKGEYVLYTRQWLKPTNKEATDSYRAVRRLSTRRMCCENGSVRVGQQWPAHAEKTVMAPDAFDNATHCHDEFQEPPVDYYGGIVYQYPYAGNGSYYFMLLPRLHHWVGPNQGWTSPESKPGGPAKIDVGLAVSRDGINFTQVGGRLPFIPVGQAGSWESRMVWGLPMPVLMPGGTPDRPESELWIYYAGGNTDHDDVVDESSTTGGKQSGISVARLRLDGWLSVDSPLSALTGEERGGSELVTVPLRFTGRQLELNVDPGGQGAVYVEIQDVHGAPIPGCALTDAYPVIVNSVAAIVRWAGNCDVAALQSYGIKLRFVMTGAKLYAFQFVE